MFGKENKTKIEPGFTNNDPISSFLGKDMQIKGDVQFSGKARIDGRVEGDVKGGSLVLSESSRVKGNIEVEALICQGKVDGDVKAQNLLVKVGGVINGSICVADLLVESGGIINGEVSVPGTELHVVEGKQPVKSQAPVVLEKKA